jgi:hypothetical protein
VYAALEEDAREEGARTATTAGSVAVGVVAVARPGELVSDPLTTVATVAAVK